MPDFDFIPLLIIGVIVGFILGLGAHPIFFPGDSDNDDSRSSVFTITISGKIGGGDYYQYIQDTDNNVWVLDGDAGLSLENISIGQNYTVHAYTDFSLFGASISDHIDKIRLVGEV